MSPRGSICRSNSPPSIRRGRANGKFGFKAAENSVFGSTVIEPLQRESVTTEIEHAKWLVWHGKGGKSVARIKALDALLMAREGYEFSTLWWNLRRLSCYIQNNNGTLVNYCARYHKGLPISSSIAELAKMPCANWSRLRQAA